MVNRLFQPAQYLIRIISFVMVQVHNWLSRVWVLGDKFPMPIATEQNIIMIRKPRSRSVLRLYSLHLEASEHRNVKSRTLELAT